MDIQDDLKAQIEDHDLAKKLEETRTKAEENLAGWKRSQADLENFQKRKEVETVEWIGLGKVSTFNQLLPILDSLEQAMTHAPDLEDEQYQNWKIGLDGILKQLETTLVQAGIEKIKAVGQKFDPHFHEAVKEVPGEEDGIVAEQYQTGYMMNGKVIRPAQVAITKKQ